MDTLAWDASTEALLTADDPSPRSPTIAPMTLVQDQIMDASFERRGPFFVSRDLHAMLDCACVPESAALQSLLPHGSADLDSPLAVPFNAKLREEFFGGILYDCDRHLHYTLNRTGFELVRIAAKRQANGAELLNALPDELSAESALSALRDLQQTGLLAPSKGSHDLTYFPARDLTLGYLQSPSIVEVEVTYGCFRRCRHCAYEASPSARLPNELTPDEWSEIFSKLAQAGTLILQLTGGDPLFREDSFEIVERAGEAGLSVYVRSDTAALNRANIERLKAVRNLWHIGTSIDGADAKMHDWMRGQGAFAVLRERTAALAEAGIDVAAGATLHRDNFRTVREIGRRVTEFGATWFDIGFLSPVGRAVQLRDLVLNESEISEALELYLEGVRAGDYAPSHMHYHRRAASAAPFEDLGPLLGKLPFVTEWPFCRLRVDPTGSTYTAGKLKNSEFSDGFNLLTSSVPHVWDRSPNLESLRVLGNGGRIHGLDYRELTGAAC